MEHIEWAHAFMIVGVMWALAFAFWALVK